MKIPTLIATALITCLALAGCARREDDADTGASTDATSPQADPLAAQPPADIPPPETASISVQVKLTADAESALQAAGDTVLVEVVFAGDPTPGASSSPTNEFGLVELGKSTQELSGSGSLEFPENLIDRSKLDKIVGQPHVIINTRSGKKSTPSNLLNCKFYWETLNIAGQAPIQIDCSLN